MKKLRKFKSKIIMLMLAIVLPLSACGLIYSTGLFKQADAETATTASYLKSYVSEVSLTNNNFSSSSSTYTLSTSLTGWSGQNNDRKTTAGIINVGGSFQNYMQGTYYLSSNPLAKSTDKHIMMINSKTSKTDNSAAKQGYKSSDIRLSANSYYSFQVSFKSDVNYIANDKYNPRGTISEETYGISANNFNTIVDGKYTKFGGYIEFSYDNTTFYLLKELDEESVDVAEVVSALPPVEPEEGEETPEIPEGYILMDAKVFYEEEEVTGEYVGVMIGETPYYIPFKFIEKGSDTNLVNIKEGAVAYTCSSIVYNPSTQRYVVTRVNDEPVTYYEKSTTYTPYSATSFGSMYLSGLKDANGESVKANFAQVSSDDWVTFYFFVATGDSEQTASLELWLGSKDSTVSGVAFYDDCHVYQYSENAFWKTYGNYLNFAYSQDWSTRGENARIETVTTNCVQLVDLSEDKHDFDLSDYNFDFEEGIYNADPTSLLNWKRDENSTGNARVFDVNSPEFFKTTTGYDFVGSDLSCTWNVKNKAVDVNENKYVLALWAKDGYSKVTSKDIKIGANEIYKVTAKYKVSELTSGSAYISITENEKFVLDTYKLKEYTPASETMSSGLSSNSDNNFVNKYATVEFYVKGNTLYSSAFNISLSIGNGSSNATGCVVFDNITIEKSNSAAFSNASNSITLGSTSDNGSVSITNGNFNNVTVDGTHPYSPDNWTITSGEGTTFGGVINTDASQFAEYVRLYGEHAKTKSDSENPYYWADFGNPGNAYGKTDADNILMLANTTSTWQKLRSDSISLSSGTTYKLSFNYKTLNLNTNTKFTVSIYGEDNFTLFTSEGLSTTGTWKTYDIYFRTFSGASNVTIQIDFGDSKNPVRGFVYLDNFMLKDGVTIPEGQDVIDMTDFYLNLPSNNITDNLFTTSTPAYSLSRTSGSGEGIIGGIVSSDMFNSNLSSIYRIEGLKAGETKNVFHITCLGEGSFAIQSNFNIDLKADSYYKLSFKLKTHFNEEKLDKDTNYAYGVTAGLTGFDYATELKSSEKYETYELFFHPTEDASSQLYICLICDSDDLAGSMALYDIAFEESNEVDYEAAVDTMNGKKFDVNSDRVYSCTQDDETADDNTDNGTESSSKKRSGESSAWLYIPTIIFGIAIIIAVVGYFMRKIKLKKIEVKRKETYDRKSSLNVDTIKKRAKEEQAQEIKEIQDIISKFQKELDEMESLHKQKVVGLRQKDKQKVSKETDKEFKQFAQKRTVIAERIESLNRQIEEIKTPEYLLNLERKLFLDEEAKRRELAQYSKKEQKSAKKASKNKKSEDNE